MKKKVIREIAGSIADLGIKTLAKMQMHKVMNKVVKNCETLKDMKPKEKTAYVDEIGLRVRTILYQIQKALNRKPPSEWVTKLLDPKGGEDEDDDGDNDEGELSQQAGVAAVAEYTYG